MNTFQRDFSLQLNNDHDVKRFDRFRDSRHRAFNLRAKFTETFANLSGTELLRSELETQCVELDVLPKGYEAERAWRTRATRYAKLLKIKIKPG